MTRAEAPAVLEDYAALVDGAIEDRLPFGDLSIHAAAGHLLRAGGKRLRPTTLLLVAGSLGTEAEDALPAALGVEYTHSFTLIHDDIMDDDPLRRGAESVHERWDIPTAILAGDYLYSRSFEALLETGVSDSTARRALGVLSSASTRVCEGQTIDVRLDETEEPTEEEYMRMAELKTSTLFAASAGIGALVGGSDDATYEAAYRYGTKLGKAFQIQDDVLDVAAPADETGKRRASDLYEDKGTLVTIHARENGVDTSLPEGATDDEVEAKVDEIRDAGSIEYARSMARDLADEAARELDALPAGEERDALEGMAGFVVGRGH